MEAIALLQTIHVFTAAAPIVILAGFMIATIASALAMLRF